MNTPLYKFMKQRGTSIYAFPSAAYDMNNCDVRFSKFTLLNIPEQNVVNGYQTKGKLNFDKDSSGPIFYNFQPGGNDDLPTLFSEQLVESLRNYVANADASIRNSRFNETDDFYNFNELTTPSEMLFWKWCRKLNILDLEPATHKIDWDKNLPDFDNNNGTGPDFFRKQLWKERQIIEYNNSILQPNSNKLEIIINQIAKFKPGDYIFIDYPDFSGVTHEILSIEFDENQTTIQTDIDYIGPQIENITIKLDYHELVKYIGEIFVESDVKTSRKNKKEISVTIPHHCGKTPTILFETYFNNNYEPGLELPILPLEQQDEIVGAENTNSPIRVNPQDYPGTHYGYFDTDDKTYKCSSGDKLRYKGDYFGINLMNNIGLDSEDYFEKLTNFNSDNIDGLKINMNRDHYLKMNLPGKTINNFDDFNATTFDIGPQDFEFNAILWYYDVDDGNGNISTNLYGIEFLNNPNDNQEYCNINNKLIQPYKKYVSNENQNGVSYTFGLNLNWDIDNGNLPLSYDSDTNYNQSALELYNKVLKTNDLIQDNFKAIINDFVNIKKELFDIRSLVYSQTQIDTIKNQINNLNNLFQLYSTFQFVDSDTAKIETNYDGSYPTLKFNVVNTTYSDIVDINVSDICEYNDIYGEDLQINVPFSNELLLTVKNDNNVFIDNTANILLSRDLEYKQSMDIIIEPDMGSIEKNLIININFNDGSEINRVKFFDVDLPVDIKTYNSLNPQDSEFYTSKYLNVNNCTYMTTLSSGETTYVEFSDNIYQEGDILYVDNFLFRNVDNEVIDLSGPYHLHLSGSTYYLEVDTSGLIPLTTHNVCYYRGWKINILRVNESKFSSLEDRYKITKCVL